MGVNNGTPEFWSKHTGAGMVVLQGPSALPLNTWTHLGITFDGTTKSFFVNGVPVATQSGLDALIYEPGPVPVTIGSDWAYNTSSQRFNGFVDEVSLYNRALTINEFFAIYNADFTGKDVTRPYFTSPSPLPDGTQGATYSQQLMTVLGTAPIGFSVNGGALPPGMTLSPTGLVSGSSNTPNTFDFTVLATDAAGKTTEQLYVLRVVGAPTVTPSTASLPVNAATITIAGSGFAPTPADNSVVFNDGAVGTVTAASANTVTVTFTTQPTGAGSLTAVVTSYGGSSGVPVQVATLTPVVTLNTANRAVSASQITIQGFGFDPTAANNMVTFNAGAVGTVTVASPTALTVTFSTKPTSTGNLTAIVTTDNVGSGAAVQVATVVAAPTVTPSTASLPVNAATITIAGSGFSPTPANNSVVFNNGAVGTVTTASANSLTVTFTTKPTVAGSLTAVVTSYGGSSGVPVQVATLTPVVTLNTANRAVSASQITIQGFGFDPTAANNMVTFNAGAVGTVTVASPTALTVTFSTKPTSTGNLTAIVTTDNVGSGAAVQVATVVAAPTVTPSTASLPVNAATITIAGSGFAPTPANNSVVFNDGAVGTVTTASATPSLSPSRRSPR